MTRTEDTMWGEIQIGDHVLDKTDAEWTVTHVWLQTRGTIAVTIRNDSSTHTLTKQADDPVRVIVPTDPDIEAAVETVQEQIPGSEVIETTDTEPETFVLPPITRPLELRAHLYLVHNHPVASLTDPAELATIHDGLHHNPATPVHYHTHEDPS